MRYKKYLPLLLIICLAAFLRLIALGKIPAGISPDEISQGYTAYSLLKTGKDEWGLPWPVTSFRSFLDYKAVLQTYLMIPSIAVFGLNEFAVRFPSALFGIFAVWAVYLLAKELFQSEKIGLLAALFLAISPWHLQFSRTALEINLSSFLFPLALYLFLKGLKKPPLILLSAFIFGLNLYTYHATKYFEPFFILALLIIFRKPLAKINLRFKLEAGLLLVLIAFPLVLATFFGSAGARASDLLITNLSVQSNDQISRLQYYSPLKNISPQLPRLFTNKATFILKQFVDNYVTYLTPSFWFTEGGREVTYSVLPGTGLLYLWLFPLVLYGGYCLIKDKHPRRSIFLVWLIFGIIPAALTKEGYRPNRVGALLTFWEIIAAYGAIELFQLKLFQNHLLKKTSALVAFVMVIFYLNTYFFEYQIRFPDALSYGFKDVVLSAASYGPNQVVIVDKGSDSQAFFAFYNKIDPAYFQLNSALWWVAVQQSHPLYLDQLEKYWLKNILFKNFNPSTDLVKGQLVIIPKDKYSDSYANDIDKIIRYPDGNPAFYFLLKK